MRWNKDLDIDDLFFIYFTDAGVGFLLVAFRDLPSMTLFAKITPKRIEATLYALLTSVMNFDILIEQPMLGAFINYEFVGVTKEDLSKYSTLCLIALICAFIGFALLPLVPLRQEVRKYQRDRYAQELISKDAR